MDMIQIR